VFDAINVYIIPKPHPPPVKDHMVPLLLANLRDAPLDNWDLTTQQVRDLV